MYYQYFGLSEEPFSIAVNPRYLFMSARHRDALAHLLYGVGSGGGFILLTGEVGTGKTTINRCLLEQLPDDTDVALILNPALNATELLASVCDEFGITYDAAAATLKTLTDSLHRFLLENHVRERKTVLLIDEAQHLDFEVLEQIRLLTNLETNSEKLLQIILIGQPELAQMLARPELRQLNQRITARYNLEPLNRQETGEYIRHRLQVAGMSPDREIFPASVVREIHGVTRGIPRVINVLCDRMLLGAYGRNEPRVDRAMLKIASAEVLGEPPGSGGVNWLLPVIAGLFLVLGFVFAGAWLLLGGDDASSPPPSAGQGTAIPLEIPTGSAALARAEDTTYATSAVGVPIDPIVAVAPSTTTPVEQQAILAAPSASKLETVLLGTGTATALLWSVYSSDEPVSGGCPIFIVRSLQCVRHEAATWDELATLDRPVVLSMITAERFAAEVLLLGIEQQQALAWSSTGVQRIALTELGPLWSGGYHYLWRVPDGFLGPLANGDEGVAIGVIAQAFAQLDEQSQPLADQVFNAALEERVRIFQQAHGLVPDGVVGVQTLLRLNAALGLDPDKRQVRERLGSSVGLEQDG